MGEASFARAKLIRQASADAKFLRNLITQKPTIEKDGHHLEEDLFDSSFSSSRSQSVRLHYNEQELYASYRQRYLVMYSPFREDHDQAETKQKKHKWFNNWKKKHKSSSSSSDQANNNDDDNNNAANNILSCLYLPNII